MESIGLLWSKHASGGYLLSFLPFLLACVAFIVLLSAYLLEDIISISMADVSQYRSIQQLNRAFQRRRTKSAPEDVTKIFEEKKKEIAEMVKESQVRRCENSEKVEVPEKKVKLSVTFNPNPQKRTIKCDSSKWDILYNWPH
ncbi:hypothetical protein T12_4510 [Trichinella patagoniensis]|uniref:Uncharacterized protein n=2 Tax=Trichinella TaxID=6333 RepID=A0A0V1AED2_9BILA|nr:hypothetical protein T12_4510 [Trichinella patagoniensis]